MRSDLVSDIASDGQKRGGDILLAISNAVVGLHKQHFGKGPTKARTYYEGDVITCVLSDIYTRSEQTLLSRGRAASVMTHRYELQEAIRDEFIAAIERITGRAVVGFFSGNQADPDLSVEVFVLGPPVPSGS